MQNWDLSLSDEILPKNSSPQNYIVQIYEGEINGHGEREGLPSEYQYEFEQEM